MAKTKYKKYRYIKEKSLSIYYLLPVLFVLGIVPLIVRAKIISLDGLELLNWKNGPIYIDFFHYYKSIYFTIGIYMGLFILLMLYWLKRLNFIRSKYYIPIAVYSFFLILSSVFSKDMDVVLRGYMEMFQGVFVLLGYVLLIIIIVNLVREKNHIIAILGSIIFTSVIIGIIGVTQYFGHDVFRTNLGLHLILSNVLYDFKDIFIFNFGKFAVYSTLYNTNFVGSFAALLIPISISLYFYQKKYKYLLLSFLFFGLMVFVGFGSNSRAGFLGIGTSMILLVILYRKVFIQKPLRVFIPLIVIVILGFILNTISDGKVLNQIQRMNPFEEIKNVQNAAEKTVYLKELDFDYYTLDIKTEEKSIQVNFVKDKNDLSFSTLDGMQLSAIHDGKKITIENDGYSDFRFVRSDNNAYYTVTAYGKTFKLWLTIDGFMVEGLNGQHYIPSQPKTIKFLEGYGDLFSNRVYIWSRSVPLLLKYIIIGSGPDMFPTAFPQDDVVGKLNYFGTVNVIVSKPHNMYLQMGINTGVLSLIAMLTLFGMYIVDSFNIYKGGNYSTLLDFVGAGLFVSIFAYLISGFFNDQILSVAPIFYGMLGLGIAINRMILKNKTDIEKN